MPRTAPGLRTDPAARIAELAAQRPEWRAWFTMLNEVERAADDAGWRNAITPAESPRVTLEGGAPLLHGQRIRVDAVRVQGLLCRLAPLASDLAGAISLRQYCPPPAEAVELIGAAVRQTRDEIEAVAEARGLGADALVSVTHLAALPLLRAISQTLQDRIPRHWPHGYCPVCAARPILAERRGLDRSRRLRCGRCAAEWEVEWLTCVFCGERDHTLLGSLIPDDSGELLKVETCATCRGYLKSIATLQALPAFELLLRDLETVELDLVALESGYSRPEGGFELAVEVA